MENNTKHTENKWSVRDAARDHSTAMKASGNRDPKFSFLEGANWQSEKDKVIIDKLVEALKNVVDQFSKVTPLYSKDELILKESNDLLNSLNIK